MDTAVDIAKGFQLENPNIFIPWATSANSLNELFRGHPLSRVSEHHYVAPSVCLGGLEVQIGFHFESRFLFFGSRLVRMQIFWIDEPPDLAAHLVNFRSAQTHLEDAFGRPHKTGESETGLPFAVWVFGRTRIAHCFDERFTLGESVEITRR